MTKRIVTKAVIAAAGLGTRFLPQTKAMPKEMLPIIDKPVIQLIVESLVSAGVKDIIIITGAQKRAIEDHFDRSYELEQALTRKGKAKEAAKIRRLAGLANFIYVRQKGDYYGNAVPLQNALHLIGDEPFYYFYADDFFLSKIPAPVQMLGAYQQTGKSVLALMDVGDDDPAKYGIIDPGRSQSDSIVSVKSIVEKPKANKAPSQLASVHGYLFTNDITKLINKTPISQRGEKEIQWAINKLAHSGKVVGKVIDGKWQDAGTRESYLRAIIDAALDDPKLGKKLQKYLLERIININY